MYLYKELKQEIFSKYSHNKSEKDTGSPEAQISLFTYRIQHLTEHLKTYKNDNSTRMGLQRLVGKRRKMLDYLRRSDIERYRAIIKELGIRK
ncbi:MAG: 30S ribosomal protein S15 [Bacteroidia bacterium]|nr:30S ribosomal protein S15 [Bacteroidia bacterium]